MHISTMGNLFVVLHFAILTLVFDEFFFSFYFHHFFSRKKFTLILHLLYLLWQMVLNVVVEFVSFIFYIFLLLFFFLCCSIYILCFIYFTFDFSFLHGKYAFTRTHTYTHRIHAIWSTQNGNLCSVIYFT